MTNPEHESKTDAASTGGAVPSEAVQPAQLEYGHHPNLPRRFLRNPLTIILMLALLSLAGAFVLLPSLNPPHVMSPSVMCASNLRQIGLACLMYANANNGHWPDDFQTLLIEEDVSSEVFVCPSSSDTRAIGPTTQAVAANLLQPGHLSYVYRGKGLSDPLAPNLVVAYERQQPNGHPGMNVLFADGHVERLDPSAVPVFLKTAQASSGAFAWNPPK